MEPQRGTGTSTGAQFIGIYQNKIAEDYTGYPVPSLHTERDCFSPRRAAAAAGAAEKVKQSSQVSGSNSTSGSA